MSKKRRGTTPSRQQQQHQAALRKTSVAGGGRISRGTAPGDAQGAAEPASSPDPGAVAADREIKHYIDIAAVRIQQWLARTPSLKQWRGASAMLSGATSYERWKDRLPVGTEWNDQAGDLAGVVSLVATAGQDVENAHAALAEAATLVAAELRDALPWCPVQAVAGSGHSYARAYAEIDARRRRGDFTLDAPAAPAEVILAKPCDCCREAPASDTATWPGEGTEKDVCEECRTRVGVVTAGRTTARRVRNSPRAEQRLHQILVNQHRLSPGFPDDFSQLAALRPPDRYDTTTQIALVYADGNRVGSFLEKAATSAIDTGIPAKSDIVGVIDGATIGALADAVQSIHRGAGVVPVLAHVVDGDDIMVSVAAPDAWPFVCSLLRRFAERVERATRRDGWPEELRAALPSLSAGVVFHHQTHPFSDVVRLTKQRLRTAKVAYRGEHPAVDFLDLTADGGHAVDRVPLLLADLDGLADTLGRIAAAPQSHRATLVTLLREIADDSLSAGRVEGGETAVDSLARRIVDIGNPGLLDLVSPGDPSVTGVHDRLRNDPGLRADLRRALDLARWWPALATAGSADEEGQR